MFATLGTRLWRWRERVSSAPPVISWQFLLQALRGEAIATTMEMPALPPVFILSTGRSGTRSLASLLQLAPNVKAWHEPMPDLYNLARLVRLSPDVDPAVVREALLLARASLWQATNLAGKRYVETSNHATFLAPGLQNMMPDARFLHITRAPAPFAHSATRMGWFTGPRASGERHRPRPDSAEAATWESRLPFAKCTWYWQEVNAFARDFVRSLPPGQGLQLRSEDVFRADPGALRRLYAMVDSEPPPGHRIQRVLGKQLNASRFHSGSRPVDDFTPAQRDLLERECGDLARELGYAGVDC